MPTPRVPSSFPYLSCRRWTRKEARQALAALEKSGQTLTAFAIASGLDPQRLVRWRRILSAIPAPRFEEILPSVVAAASASDLVARGTPGRFEIVLASGRIVRVPESFDAGALLRLLSVVEEGRAC
jgi:hypothetical protein